MNSNGFPTWIKVIAQVGFPIAVAVYLFIVIYPLVQSTSAKMDAHIKVVEGSVAQIEEQTRILKIICRNIAKNDFDRANCDK